MPDQAFTGSLKPGVMLDKYEVRERTAVGGMAIIYKAYDATLDRYVAVKQVAPHLAMDEKFAVRFRTEAQTLARLSSAQPNIVHVHELIQQDGQLYLVMEYVEGTTLRAMMDKGPIPFQTGLGVMLSVSLGLRAIHAHGIVHRDLTPGNVMMARDGALKITDFGLIGHSGGRTSLPMGTTKYMAPEMFTGAPVDPRADLYSLGMMAYEMFAGPEKFGEAFRDVLRDEKAQQVRWMHWHSNQALRAPLLKDIQPGIPPLISKVVERLMDKDPSRRFASADQVVKWLRKIFVMNVQAKSVTPSENEQIEKEMEADTLAPVAVRAGSAGAAAAAGAAAGPESGERTAPLPKPAWTWQRAAFWAAIVCLPLILAAGGIVYWKYSEKQERRGMAASAAQVAADLFKRGEFASAAQAYVKFKMEFSDLRDMVVEADRWELMARAEAALLAKEWEKADAFANDAQAKEADGRWQSDFRNRHQKARDVEDKMVQAEAAAKAGDFEGAIARLTDLISQYPDLKLNDKLAELRDKVELREYRALVDQGKQEFERNLDAALDLFNKARQKRETPEVIDLIQKTTLEKELAVRHAQAEQAAKAGKWDDAARLYEECLKLRPADVIRQKMNNAKAEALAAQAKTLRENNLLEDAKKKYTEVLQFNPQHAEALNFLRIQGQAENLARFIRAGDEAKAKGDWDAAINSYVAAKPLADPKDHKAIDDKIAECRQQSALAKSREALGQNDFAKARQHAVEAQSIADNQEVKDLVAQIDKRENYTTRLNVGKELLAQADYIKALAELQAAQKIDDTPEVRELITECQYRRYMAQAKLLLNSKKYAEAKAMFGVARRYRDTIEAQGGESEAERLRKEAEKSAQGGGT